MESIIRGEKCSGLIANGAIWIMVDFREELLLLSLTWSSGDVSSDHWPVSGAMEENRRVQTVFHILMMSLFLFSTSTTYDKWLFCF